MDYSHPILLWSRRCGQKLGVLRPFIRAYRKVFAIKYEQKFDEVMLGQVSAGDIVWDVGANVGYFRDKFALATGPSGLPISMARPISMLPLMVPILGTDCSRLDPM